MIEVEETPLDAPAAIRPPDEGVVISRGTRVYLRTFTRGDLVWLTEWVEDPYLERMVGSEFLHAFKHDWDKAPGFHDAVMNDPTQVVLIERWESEDAMRSFHERPEFTSLERTLDNKPSVEIFTTA